MASAGRTNKLVAISGYKYFSTEEKWFSNEGT